MATVCVECGKMPRFIKSSAPAQAEPSSYGRDARDRSDVASVSAAAWTVTHADTALTAADVDGLEDLLAALLAERVRRPRPAQR